jgi:molybdopterin converting factor small subunit
MKVNILVFGQLAERLGNNNFQLSDISDTDSLLSALKSSYPALEGQKILIAVNKKQITGNTMLHDAAEVALMPAFSGG